MSLCIQATTFFNGSAAVHSEHSQSLNFLHVSFLSLSAHTSAIKLKTKVKLVRIVFLRGTTCNAISRMSYRNSVRPSVRLSVSHNPVPIRTQVRLRVLPYNSVESLVTCDNILCCWLRDFFSNKSEKRVTPKYVNLLLLACLT